MTPEQRKRALAQGEALRKKLAARDAAKAQKLLDKGRGIKPKKVQVIKAAPPVKAKAVPKPKTLRETIRRRNERLRTGT